MITVKKSTARVLAGTSDTVLSWTTVLSSLQEIPSLYRESFNQIEKGAFPYTVFVPAINGLFFRATEKLLCESDGSIHIWERIGMSIRHLAYPIDAIAFLEEGCVLLNSWITLAGITDDGVSQATTISFNTATAKCFKPLVLKMRPAVRAESESDMNCEMSKFSFLAATSYKFMNYARDSLVRGDHVERILLQRVIKKPFPGVFGCVAQRTISPEHLAVLTDRDVVFIGDDGGGVRQNSKQGGIKQFIPLRYISYAGMDFSDDGLATLSLSIDACGGKRISKRFSDGNTQVLEEFLEALRTSVAATQMQRHEIRAGEQACAISKNSL